MAPRREEDRRPRADLKRPVIVETADGSMDGVMENASSTGLFIACASPLRPKALCELIINVPVGGQRFRVTAEVVWSRAGRPSVPSGMGVRFVKISGTDRKTISDQGFGGDSSNFAIAAARQGARVAYVSAVGDDPYGRMLRELWDRDGVDHAGVKTDPQAFTAIYFVTHDASGHHFHFFRQGSAASRMSPTQLPRDSIASAKVLHLSGISLAISAAACDTGYATIDAARKAGARVSFDTNLRRQLWPLARARAVMNDVMRFADICLPSYDDLAAVTGLVEPDAIVII